MTDHEKKGHSARMIRDLSTSNEMESIDNTTIPNVAGDDGIQANILPEGGDIVENNNVTTVDTTPLVTEVTDSIFNRVTSSRIETDTYDNRNLLHIPNLNPNILETITYDEQQSFVFKSNVRCSYSCEGIDDSLSSGIFAMYNGNNYICITTTTSYEANLVNEQSGKLIMRPLNIIDEVSDTRNTKIILHYKNDIFEYCYTPL
jgi:hypothetical protein